MKSESEKKENGKNRYGVVGVFRRHFRARLVCKMLKVSMLQSLELINSVETPTFSTISVEKPERSWRVNRHPESDIRHCAVSLAAILTDMCTRRNSFVNLIESGRFSYAKFPNTFVSPDVA
jgi:hypothetical protein